MMTLDEEKRLLALSDRRFDWEVAQCDGWTITTGKHPDVFTREDWRDPVSLIHMNFPFGTPLIVLRKDGKLKDAIEPQSDDAIADVLKLSNFNGYRTVIPSYSTDVEVALRLWKPNDYWVLELTGKGNEPIAHAGIYHNSEGYPPSAQTRGDTLARAICFEFLNRAPKKE